MQVGSVVQSVKTARRAGLNASGAAFCGGVLGAMAVMVHEGYTVFSGHCLPIDPFTYVMAELAVGAPAGAAVLCIAANVRNWLVR